MHTKLFKAAAFCVKYKAGKADFEYLPCEVNHSSFICPCRRDRSIFTRKKKPFSSRTSIQHKPSEKIFMLMKVQHLSYKLSKALNLSMWKNYILPSIYARPAGLESSLTFMDPWPLSTKNTFRCVFRKEGIWFFVKVVHYYFSHIKEVYYRFWIKSYKCMELFWSTAWVNPLCKHLDSEFSSREK